MAIPDEILPVRLEAHQEISKQVHEAVHHAGVKVPGIPVRVPRPPNSFILYRQSLHSSTTAENPGLRNTEICKPGQLLFPRWILTYDIPARVIADKWRNESPEVRAHFKALADELKRQHEVDHPDYQYSPRRPGERRRRQPRIHAKNLKFLGATTEGTRRLVNSYAGPRRGWVDVDDQLLRLFDGHGMMFGPSAVGPQLCPDSGDFDMLVDDQVDRVRTFDLISTVNANDFDIDFNMDELLNIN